MISTLFALALALPLPAAAAGTQLAAQVTSPTPVSVIPGMQRIPLLQIVLTASCDGDVPVEELRLRHRGAGAAGDFSALYAAVAGSRVSRAVIADRRGGIVIPFRDFVVPSCGSVAMQVLGDLSAEASPVGQHVFFLEPNGIAAPGAAVDVRLTSSLSDPVRTVPGTFGTVSVEYPSVLTAVRYGANRTILRIRLSADGGTDHLLKEVTLTNDGSAQDCDLRNISVFSSRGGRLTKSADCLKGDAVRLVFSTPVVLARNEERLFEVRADIRASRSRTIRLRIEEPADLVSVPLRGRRRD